MTELQQLRNSRRKVTAEDFTSEPLVNEMLDKLPQEVWFSEKTFCDPAAGNGNFLVEVIKRKLAAGSTKLQALSTTYGVELMVDNVEEMKERLLNEVLPLSEEDLETANKILKYNIICHNALTWDFDNWKSTERKVKALF